jgi:hypothetical protein
MKTENVDYFSDGVEHCLLLETSTTRSPWENPRPLKYVGGANSGNILSFIADFMSASVCIRQM